MGLTSRERDWIAPKHPKTKKRGSLTTPAPRFELGSKRIRELSP
jgi:hypothetical protein